MKNLLVFIVITGFLGCVNSKMTTLTPEEEIKAFQQHLTSEYKDSTTSPYKSKVAEFKGHEFFPIDLDYRVEATFVSFENESFFDMPTSGVRKPKYRKFGKLQFQLDGKDYELTLYQNLSSMKNPIYKDYLFLPFNDDTNGVSTYDGGRYIDFRIPDGKTTTLDFNQSYNPYCAYVDGYSCPIPPAENYLKTEIKAGIMLKKTK